MEPDDDPELSCFLSFLPRFFSLATKAASSPALFLEFDDSLRLLWRLSLRSRLLLLLLASFATWMNDTENLVSVSAEDVSFQDAKGKTRLVDKQAKNAALLKAALFYINENVTWMQYALYCIYTM